MISEEQVRASLARYVELVGAGDIDGILALYAEDATVEDPVGKPPYVGIEAISRFYREGLGRLDATARLDGSIRATRNCGAVPFCVDLDWGGSLRTIEVIDVMEFDAEGRIRSMKAYWGESNMIAREQP
ncbi:nuclear transport factor 2 family protein [Pseudomonas boanensis]|uniref:Nuclear transport factor 2 family protein n=1 Tax=Metapseudomonas boanensis TaxID=2822138 RepID=A0ABS5XE88_9GAMM|nr:nuclear transport factor 2 family protein [Pseudomonas boanensis]MBT8766002.1 nuclear transport factor 2 family protein [Pseudomonas boanensis]